MVIRFAFEQMRVLGMEQRLGRDDHGWGLQGMLVWWFSDGHSMHAFLWQVGSGLRWQEVDK